MKWVQGTVGGVVVTILVFAALSVTWIYIGGFECDRAQCNAIGEFGDKHGAIVGALDLAVGVLAGFFVGSRIARRRTSRSPSAEAHGTRSA